MRIDGDISEANNKSIGMVTPIFLFFVSFFFSVKWARANMRAKKNNITCYPVNNGYFNRGLKRCRIDGDVSDANTKSMGIVLPFLRFLKG